MNRRTGPSRRWLAPVLGLALATVGLAAGSPLEAQAPIRIGAVFPLTGNAGGLAAQEYRGVRIAADLVNAGGGVNGRRIELDVRDLESADQAPAVMASLRAGGESVVLGAYSSDLSEAASAAASAEGLVYWEAGAVADRLTGRGLPLVFRVGASGTTLGDDSATFAADELAPRLGRRPTDLRLAIVAADDDYAASVADAAARTATGAGVPIVARLTYDLLMPRWASIMQRLGAVRPDVVVLASHIPDGVAFRHAMVAAGLHVGALIGTTMAECDPDFAGELGAEAIGIFASDRPVAGFRPGALAPAALAVYRRFAAAWDAGDAVEVRRDAGSDAALGWGAWSAAPGGGYAGRGSSPGSGMSNARFAIAGPASAVTLGGPTEEAISGFTAAWALFRDVLPSATGLDAASVAAAARRVDLPQGSLPNGAGLRFSSDPGALGQNERAAGVIWQWQAVQSYTYVWPPTYATGSIGFVPLPR
ncbi:MAG TPA: ABC transporter substrate-binding protein [Candidatus Dormibacteraeota bacterium]|nr:ABC transporter substrate-binding protein [Candidatus Dormibacteraeota bacterium]